MFSGLKSQNGFATLEVILMITVLGILSAIAIPRFTAVTTSANTAKVQSDLSTLDTAIAVYQMEKGDNPSDIKDLEDYIQDADKLKPPTGKVYINGNEEDMPATVYSISTDDGNCRAKIGSYTAGSITKVKQSQS